jgi:hypothetical protein
MVVEASSLHSILAAGVRRRDAEAIAEASRRLFGCRASSVDQLIADRDSMLSAAGQRVRAAEARIAELEEELKRREEDLEAVHREAPLAPPAAVPATPPRPEPPAMEPSPASPPATQSSAAETEGESDEPDEIEEWPVPTVSPRTVDFTPPSESTPISTPCPSVARKATGR